MIHDLLTENEILNYLMTSDFNEGLTKEESKFLLLKYRNFYRLTYAKNEQMTFTIEELKVNEESMKKELLLANESIQNLKDELEKEKKRDLSWRERLFGKKIKK